MTKRLRNGPSQRTFPKESGSEVQVEVAQALDYEVFLTEMYQQLNVPVCTYLARLVQNDEIGKDLAHDAWRKAWEALPSKPVEIPFKPWFYRIATNTSISYLRHTNLLQWQALETAKSIEVSSRKGFEDGICDRELIEKALGRLPEKQRICLCLRIYANLTDDEIALMLEIDKHTVTSNITRAKKSFYHIFTQLGGEVV